MPKPTKRPNSPWMSPYLTVRDADKAIEFYQKAFGFQLREAVRYDGKAQHVEMTWKEALIMFAPVARRGTSRHRRITQVLRRPAGPAGQAHERRASAQEAIANLGSVVGREAGHRLILPVAVALFANLAPVLLTANRLLDGLEARCGPGLCGNERLHVTPIPCHYLCE